HNHRPDNKKEGEEEMTEQELCPNCGRSTVRTRPLSRYEYSESGLDGIILTGNLVLSATCSDCGESFVTVLMEQQLLQVIAMDLLIRQGFLNGKELRYLREMCGLTQAELSKRLGLSGRQSVIRWEREAVPDRQWGAELLL